MSIVHKSQARLSKWLKAGGHYPDLDVPFSKALLVATLKMQYPRLVENVISRFARNPEYGMDRDRFLIGCSDILGLMPGLPSIPKIDARIRKEQEESLSRAPTVKLQNCHLSSAEKAIPWVVKDGQVVTPLVFINGQVAERGSSTSSADPRSNDFLSSYEWRRLRMQALKKHGARCQCCGASAATGAVLNVDHIKPRKTHPQLALELDNLQVLCDACNHGKGNWDTTDWRNAKADDGEAEKIRQKQLSKIAEDLRTHFEEKLGEAFFNEHFKHRPPVT